MLIHTPGEGAGQPAFVVGEMIARFPHQRVSLRAQLGLQQRIVFPKTITDAGDGLILHVFFTLAEAEKGIQSLIHTEGEAAAMAWKPSVRVAAQRANRPPSE